MFELNVLNQSHQARPARLSEKVMQISVDFIKKINLILDNFFSNLTYNDSDRPCNVLLRETIRFWTNSTIFELYAKMYEIMAKDWLYEKRYNFEKD